MTTLLVAPDAETHELFPATHPQGPATRAALRAAFDGAKATLAAARAAFKRRIVAVFQPHRYTRMRDLFEGFLRAFDDADMLCLMDIYPAGEDAIPGVSSHRLYEAILKRGHLNVRYLGAPTGAAQKLAELTMPGDVVLTLGAGDIYQLGDQILAELGVERKTHEQA